MSGIRGIALPQKQDHFGIGEIDEQDIACLPPDTTITNVSPHGSSFWTRTSRIDVILHSSKPHSYFMKLATGDVGCGMLRGEYEGAKAIYDMIPEGIPRPVAWGTYKAKPDTHFFLCDFIVMDMNTPLPEINAFCLLLAKLHRTSSLCSPNSIFGFHVATYEGTMRHDTTWCDTWEESFTLRMKYSLQQECLAHGPQKGNEDLLSALYEKVIPRLLRPLQTKGRSLKPALLHGDIWLGNISVNASTKEPVMFDPCAFWGHNECDLTAMGIPRYNMGDHWKREYHKYFPISAPEDDYLGRMALYELRSHICISTLYPETPGIRGLLFNNIRELVEKFPDGYQGQ